MYKHKCKNKTVKENKQTELCILSSFSPLVQDGLMRWAKQIETGYCLISGRQALDDTELFLGQVKTNQSFLCHINYIFNIKLTFFFFLAEKEPKDKPPSDTPCADPCLRCELILIFSLTLIYEWGIHVCIDSGVIRISMSQEKSEVDERCSAVVQVCSGSMRVRGMVHCRAYIHNNKPKARHAAQVIKAYYQYLKRRDVQFRYCIVYEI